MNSSKQKAIFVMNWCGYYVHHFVNKSAPTGPHNECVESGCQNNSLLSNVRGRLNSSCSEPVELAPVKDPVFTQSMRCCDWTECWQTRHLLQRYFPLSLIHFVFYFIFYVRFTVLMKWTGENKHKIQTSNSRWIFFSFFLFVNDFVYKYLLNKLKPTLQAFINNLKHIYEVDRHVYLITWLMIRLSKKVKNGHHVISQ